VLSQGEPRDVSVYIDTIEFCNKSITEHGNLVDADASGAKASTEHLESRLEIITHFEITEKATRGCVLLSNNSGFRVGNFEGNV